MYLAVYLCTVWLYLRHVFLLLRTCSDLPRAPDMPTQHQHVHVYTHDIDTVSTAPVKPQERQRHGLGNMRARRTNTANRAPNMLVNHGHVAVQVCTISILWNFRTNPYQVQ